MWWIEVDDYGILEKRRCGCYLEECGYTLHVRDIHRLRKLTGEGMTIMGTDMIRILEEELPSEFGGSALDYQLVDDAAYADQLAHQWRSGGASIS